MDQPLRVLSDPTTLPSDAAAALHQALRAGLVAVVPGDPGGARVWWTVDPADGSARAILAPGLGGARGATPRPPDVYHGGMDFDPWERGATRGLGRSNMVREIDPRTMRETGFSKDGTRYRYGKPTPRKKERCRRGTEYLGVIGCVSTPLVWVAGTVGVAIVALAVVRLAIAVL
jgi:hypothetical protein